MLAYLRSNYLAALKHSPLRGWRRSLALFAGFATLALAIGLGGGLFRLELLHSDLLYLLPVILFVFPSFLEESVFRGILIPLDTAGQGRAVIVRRVAVSSVVFVLWHPLNAMTINPGARELFLDPLFLLLALLLGISCGLAYIYSRSLWVPVIMHWLTVLVWVSLLGGRNLVLQG